MRAREDGSSRCIESTSHAASLSFPTSSGRGFASSSSNTSESTVSILTSWLRKSLGIGSQEASAGAQSSSSASRPPTTRKKRNPRSSSSSSTPISEAQKGWELRKLRKQKKKEELRAAAEPLPPRRRAKEEKARANTAVAVAPNVGAAAPASASSVSASAAPPGPELGALPITYRQLQASASASVAAAAEGGGGSAPPFSSSSSSSKRRSNAAPAATTLKAPPLPSPSPSPSGPVAAAVRERLAHFEGSAAMRDRALALYVNGALFSEAAATFSDTAAAGFFPSARPASEGKRRRKGKGAAGAGEAEAAAPGPPLILPAAAETKGEEDTVFSAAAAALASLPLGPASDAALFPLFADHVLSRYARRIKTYRDVVLSLDMTSPHLWFPAARALAPRKVTYHAGPTNSGKTHSALEALAAADSGVYCGPLRLLAMEVADDLNARGVRCDLVTGQESRTVEGSRHVACTVEMAEVREKVKGSSPSSPFLTSSSLTSDPSFFFDVAVLDEIQLIGDPSRGWAWTRALHGLPAKEVHVCGDGSAASLVEALCARSGDDFELVRHSRFRPLRVDEEGLPRGLADVQPGDCVVAFSRAVRLKKDFFFAFFLSYPDEKNTP